MYFPCLSYQ